ncbi:MAG: NAD(P)/FAD-dependent oxidoreductase [Chthonomonadales bacterium]
MTATRLRKQLDQRHRIILVNREPEFALAASFLWVATGKRKPHQITKSLELLKNKGIEVVTGEVERINAARKEAVVSGRILRGDFLVVSLGAEFCPEAVPGLGDAGLTFCTLDGASRLREAVERIQSGRVLIVTADPAYKCPAAPYEAAMLLHDLFRRRGVRNRIQIELHAAEAAPMAVAGANVSRAVQEMVERCAVTYFPEHRIASAHAEHVEFTDGVRRDFALLVYVPPIRPPDAVRQSDLAGDSGWVDVDRYTLATRFPDVYAVGGVTLIPLAMGKPLPRAGVFAHGQAEVVAARIASTVAGRSQDVRFEGRGGCFVETGGGRAAFGAGNFYADPHPTVRMRSPSRVWHIGKILLERQILSQWF